MGKVTGVSWTDATVNPWMGCHKVSEGCRECYMFREQKHYGNDPNVVRRSKTTFNDPLKWKEPKRIFVCSWSDFFIEEADPWREEFWDIIHKTPYHKYQIPTKRIDNILDRLPSDWGNGWDNVMLIASMENQEMFDSRIEKFLRIPSKFYGISAEPLIGKLIIDDIYLFDYAWGRSAKAKKEMGFIDWIIAGAESGPDARPANIEWFRILRDDCKRAKIPYFLKQMWIDGKLVKEPFLDGRQWLEFPDNF